MKSTENGANNFMKNLFAKSIYPTEEWFEKASRQIELLEFVGSDEGQKNYLVRFLEIIKLVRDAAPEEWTYNMMAHAIFDRYDMDSHSQIYPLQF